jgi:type IV secretion system protein VirB8
MSDDVLLAPSDDRIATIREPLFANIIAAQRAEEQYNAERSRAVWWIGGIATALIVLLAAALVVVVVYHRPVVRYTEIDDASGVIRESWGATDAPDHFNDRVVRHYLAEYIGLRERFVWQMDPETDHRVKLMSAPAEQARYAEDKAKADPATKYGMSGYARVLKFVAFTPRGKGRDKTLEYDVQFIKGEVLSNNLQKPVETHITARIVFQFHPEISMSDQDRLDNESGLFVISYNSSADY